MAREVVCVAKLLTFAVLVITFAHSQGLHVGGVYFNGKNEHIAPNLPLIQSPGDTLYSFPAPGTWPAGLAWDGIYLWHTDADADLLYKLDTTGNIIASFPVPSGIQALTGIAWDGSILWGVAEEEARLYKIDPTTGEPLGYFDLPNTDCFGLDWDGTYLWVSSYSWVLPQIYKIDPSDGQVVYQFPAHTDGILGIAWDDSYLCGVDISRMQLYKMNPSDGSVVDSIAWQVPYPLGLVWKDAYWWNVSSKSAYGGNERIYKIDAGTPGIVDDGSTQVSSKYGICRVYPNPLYSTVSIEYACPHNTYLGLIIYDIQGELIRALMEGVVSAGTHTITWDGRDNSGRKVSSGVYFLKFQADDCSATEKLLLIR